MKQLLLTGIFLLFTWQLLQAQQQTPLKKKTTMQLNAGIVTAKLAESKKFYLENLGFGVSFENEFYLLLHTPDRTAEISFLCPDHPSQQPLFHRAFSGHGMYLTIEVSDVVMWYKKLQQQQVPIHIPLRSEPWGDQHFAIKDPNGIAIDIVQYTRPTTAQ
jgi:catechol 2,3-dioxygenase-like lactoylglutathione lyase family enzyme